MALKLLPPAHTAKAPLRERLLREARSEATSDEAKRRFTDAVAAETVRLGLLCLHAGGGSVESLTADLGSAREVSAEIERLLAERAEVERLLGQ